MSAINCSVRPLLSGIVVQQNNCLKALITFVAVVLWPIGMMLVRNWLRCNNLDHHSNRDRLRFLGMALMVCNQSAPYCCLEVGLDTTCMKEWCQFHYLSLASTVRCVDCLVHSMQEGIIRTYFHYPKSAFLDNLVTYVTKEKENYFHFTNLPRKMAW